MADTDTDDRRLLATVAALGPRAPDSTLRPSPGVAYTDALRSLPRVVLAPDGETASPEGGETLALHELLGEGGMGRVFAATQRSLNRNVAVKLLDDDDPSRRAALLHEARITGRLEHPNVAPVHVLGVDPTGSPVMVMKRIEGVSWRELQQDPSHAAWSALESRHRDRLEAQVSVLLSVCDALEYAHARGIVHRDVKPENVMLGPFGEVYLLDWGVALDLAAPQGDRSIVGTPAYMAPEMVVGDLAHVTERTDVYLLGATLHEALTGAPRHGGETLEEVLRAARRSAPVDYDASVPEDLAALCNDATARDTDARPESVRAFRTRLLDHRQHRDSLALSDDASRALREALTATPPLSRGAWERALQDCRFGFTEALSRWPENRAAREGLRRAFDAMVRHALDDDRPEVARARYAEWPDADPAVGLLVDASEARAAERSALALKASALSKDLDLGAVRRGYVVAMGVLTLVAATVTGGLMLLGGRDGAPPPLPLILRVDVAVLVLAAALLSALRRRVLANRLGARLAAVTLGALSCLLVADLASVGLGADIYAATPVRFLLLAVGFSTASTQGLRALWIAAVFATSTALGSAAFPARMNLVVMVGTSLTAASIAVMVLAGWLRSDVADALSEARRPSANAPSARGTRAPP